MGIEIFLPKSGTQSNKNFIKDNESRIEQDKCSRFKKKIKIANAFYVILGKHILRRGLCRIHNLNFSINKLLAGNILLCICEKQIIIIVSKCFYLYVKYTLQNSRICPCLLFVDILKSGLYFQSCLPQCSKVNDLLMVYPVSDRKEHGTHLKISVVQHLKNRLHPS